MGATIIDTSESVSTFNSCVEGIALKWWSLVQQGTTAVNTVTMQCAEIELKAVASQCSDDTSTAAFGRSDWTSATVSHIVLGSR